MADKRNTIGGHVAVAKFEYGLLNGWRHPTIDAVADYIIKLRFAKQVSGNVALLDLHIGESQSSDFAVACFDLLASQFEPKKMRFRKTGGQRLRRLACLNSAALLGATSFRWRVKSMHRCHRREPGRLTKDDRHRNIGHLIIV
jgi:hypothetical protein